MKKLSIIIAITLMGLSVMFSSCKSSKSAQTSNQSSTKIKKDSSQSAVKPSGKAMENTSENEDMSTLALTKTKQDFSNLHNSANDVIWEEYISENKTKNYTVTYKEDSKNNSIVYAADGTIIEERHDILIDQLPQNIYNAVKTSYPDYKIIDASTYKHINKEGSYLVRIKPINGLDVNEKELIFKENGIVAQ